MSTSSRIAVARILHGVFGEGRRVPEGWDRELSREDAAFARALLGFCLRGWGRLQAFVAPQLKDPGRGLPLGSQVALGLGFAQLAWMPGVSDHAAVNEAVELAADRELGFPPHRGLVNALLRRAARDRGGLAEGLDALPSTLDRGPFAQRVLEAALAPHGAPECVEELWKRLQEPPHPCFRALKDGPLPPGLTEDPLLPGCLELAEGADFPRDWLASGAGMVQDRSSQALLAFAWDRLPTRILDACAAPGGKTTALALRFPQARLFALEQQGARAERLRENLAVRGVQAEVVQAEAGDWLRQGGRGFDLILLDAPCSGSGTFQKHPELPWIGDGLDLARLAETQRTLLEAAASRLAPGGLLIYAVCSWLPEEGEAHRQWLLEAHPELAPAAVWPQGFGTEPGPTAFFRPHPLAWRGEGFQAFAFSRSSY